MSLVALDGTPLIRLGSLWHPGMNVAWGSTSTLQDAAKEATIMYGNIMTDDGASHTIDTTGSSSLQWRSGATTFANAGSTFKVGLATMDLGNGPAGRATNATDVITLSVSKSLTGNAVSPIPANSWQTNVPDAGTLTVANGDFIAFCTQLTAVAGGDLINTVTTTTSSTINRPSVTSYVGAAYAGVTTTPNCIISFSDGHLGWFANSNPNASLANVVWNSGSALVEYGNHLKFPWPVKIYGMYAMAILAGDTDFVLYSDPFGTPVPEKTVSVDANALASTAAVREIDVLFTSPYTAYANQPLAAIIKPGASNVTCVNRTYNASAHQVTDHCGTNGYTVNRASGVFLVMNTNKDRFPVGFLVGAAPGRNAPINAKDLVR